MEREFHVSGSKAEWLAALEQHRKTERIREAAPLLLEALERIATVDMGGGFLGAAACRKIARAAITAATGEG